MRSVKTVRNLTSKMQCVSLTGKGTPCQRPCLKGRPTCGTHAKAFLRDHPPESSRLSETGTTTESGVLRIMDTMRANMPLMTTMFVKILLTRQIFDPAENANKFIVGGVTEVLFAALLNSLGFPTKNVAATKTVIDHEIEVPGVVSFGSSLKCSGGIDQQPILENYRGESKTDIRPLPPTFIIYTETKMKRTRIVYIDHEILRSAYPDADDVTFNAKVYNKKAEGDKQSSLTFRSGFLKSFIPILPASYIVDVPFPESIPLAARMDVSCLVLGHVESVLATATMDAEMS